MDQQLIFEHLMNNLVRAPVMAYPDFPKSFILCADASGKGLGAVPYQRQHGETKVIAYSSRRRKELPPSFGKV